MGQYKWNSNSKENQCLFKSYVRISNFQGNMASIDVIKSICWMHSIMFMTHSRQITTVDTLLIYKKSNRHSSHWLLITPGINYCKANKKQIFEVRSLSKSRPDYHRKNFELHKDSWETVSLTQKLPHIERITTRPFDIKILLKIKYVLIVL